MQIGTEERKRVKWAKGIQLHPQKAENGPTCKRTLCPAEEASSDFISARKVKSRAKTGRFQEIGSQVFRSRVQEANSVLVDSERNQ
ncbi:hypothetical protein CEXT_276701 [Caerostris extrusa]|uniref:Uncharacterized protein n=1 Tax=Caerostris extrusa TaxID=172846 RepID=A0AAV4QII0_CAEEX|nr:hypothetical protein CEXT_276701 [Caerostris extrusa]